VCVWELHKKELYSLVKSFVRLTNYDWHDGYMEQNEKIQEYVTRAGKFLHDPKFACATMRLCVQVHV